MQVKCDKLVKQVSQLASDNSKHTALLSHLSANSVDSLRDMNREILDRIIKVEEKVTQMNETRLRDVEQT